MASADIMAKLMKEAKKEWTFRGNGSLSGMQLRSGRIVGRIVISRESLEKRVAHISSLLHRMDCLMVEGPKGEIVFRNHNNELMFSHLLACLMNFLRLYCQDILAQLPRLTNLLLDTIAMSLDNLGEIRSGSFLSDSCHKFNRLEKRIQRRCDFM